MTIRFSISLGRGEDCKRCFQSISPSSLRLKDHSGYSSDYYHIGCFQPYDDFPVIIDRDVDLEAMSEEWEESAKQWVVRWNRRFVTCEREVPQVYKTKSVASKEASRRRLWLAVCQYLSSNSILHALARVNRELYHATWEEELWQTRFAMDFPRISTVPTESYRTLYISYALKSCWCCRTPLSLEDIKGLCPKRRAVMCEKCYTAVDNKVVWIGSYCAYHEIKPDLLRYLRFPTFQCEGREAGFLIDARRLIVPYAKRRKTILVDWLQRDFPLTISARTFAAMETAKLRQFYLNRSPLYGFPRAFLQFLGRSEGDEDLEKSKTKFLKRIERYEKANKDSSD